MEKLILFVIGQVLGLQSYQVGSVCLWVRKIISKMGKPLCAYVEGHLEGPILLPLSLSFTEAWRSPLSQEERMASLQGRQMNWFGDPLPVGIQLWKDQIIVPIMSYQILSLPCHTAHELRPAPCPGLVHAASSSSLPLGESKRPHL